MNKPGDDPLAKTAPTVVVVNLGELGRRLETANFLLVIASGVFVLLALFALWELALSSWMLWEFAFPLSASDAEDSKTFVLSSLPFVVMSFAIAGVFLLWAVAIARMWTWGVFIGALAFAIGWSAASVLGAAFWDGSFTGLLLQVLYNLIVLLFLIQLAAGGWQIARVPKSDRGLFTVVPVGTLSFRQTVARMLGISPGCRWVPHAGRRFTAALLFVLASGAVGLATAVLVFTVSSAEASIAAAVIGPCPESENFFDLDCRSRMTVFTGVLIVTTGACFGLAVVLRLAARRFARVALEKLELSDKRPPLLFLRSFHDDQVGLDWPKRPIFERLFALGEPRPMLDHLLVEEGSVFGPVIAVGKPSKPAPFGALRIFFDDQAWQSAVRDLAQKAKAIVIVADDTPGVHWELTLLHEARHTAKTLYLLPPALSVAERGAAVLLREANAVVKPKGNIIGWYPSGDTLNVLTDELPSRSSYVLALRLFIRSRFVDDRAKPDLDGRAVSTT